MVILFSLLSVPQVWRLKLISVYSLCVCLLEHCVVTVCFLCACKSWYLS